MLIVRTLIAAVLVIISAAALPMEGRPLGPGIDDEGDGSFSGWFGWDEPAPADDGGRGGSSSSAGRDEEPEPRDQVPQTNCDRGPDGELLTPWDCPVELVEVFDRDTAEQLARRLVVRLQLPKPTPQFGPDPEANEWNMAVVGYPLWLWTEGPRTVSATESAHGRTFTLKARQISTTFTLGDGHSITCKKTTKYKPTARPGSPSPTCGHTYQRASKDSYTITATTKWTVTWSVAGFSGTLPGTHSASRELKVGELQALVTA